MIGIARLRDGGGAISAVASANAIAEQGIPVLMIGADGPGRVRLSSSVAYVPLPSSGSLPRAITTVARTIRDFRPTVIHVHGAGFAIVTRIAAIAARRRTPQVMTHHSAVLLRVPSMLSPVGALLVRSFSDHLVSITSWNQRYLEVLAGGKTPVSVLPNFIDVRLFRERMALVDKAATREKFGLTNDQRVVTFVARLVPMKGLEAFVRAMASYRKTGGPEAVGIVVGDGPLAPSAKELAEQLNAPVRFVGFQEDVSACLAISDVAVFTSEREVLPTVALEAAAAGLPIVSSDIPGHREIIENNVNGFLVSHEDQYAEFLKLLLERKDEAERQGQNGYALVLRKFDKPAVLPQLLDLYRSLEARVAAR